MEILSIEFQKKKKCFKTQISFFLLCSLVSNNFFFFLDFYLFFFFKLHKSASRREKQKHQKITKHREPVAYYFINIHFCKYTISLIFFFFLQNQKFLSLAATRTNILVYISFLPVLGASYKKYWDAAVTRNDGITQSASAVGDSFVIIGGEKKEISIYSSRFLYNAI